MDARGFLRTFTIFAEYEFESHQITSWYFNIIMYLCIQQMVILNSYIMYTDKTKV